MRRSKKDEPSELDRQAEPVGSSPAEPVALAEEVTLAEEMTPADEMTLAVAAAPEGELDVADDEVPAPDASAAEVAVAALAEPDAPDRRRQLTAVIEALLFASEEPITVPALKKVIDDATTDELKEALQDLKTEYDAAGRGVALFEMGGGYLICTRDMFAPWVEKMIKGKRRVRLSRAGLETIAVVAYKQPISRAEIERIRGVDCGGVLGTLVERDLITIKGRDTGPGKPLLYGTTQEFLNYFGLNRIGELPRLDELSTLAARNPTWSEAERARFQKHGVETMEMFPTEEPPDESLAEPAEGESLAAAGEAAGQDEPAEAADRELPRERDDDADELAEERSADEARPV